MPENALFAALFGTPPLHTLKAADFPEDRHSFFNDPEIFSELIELARPELIIEVGTWKGHSANAMADDCKKHGIEAKIICVDTWLGSVEHWMNPLYLRELHLRNGRATIWERFVGNTLRRKNQDCIYPLPLPSSTASAVLAQMTVKADLIYIDAAHGYDDVMADISNYFPLLAEDGIMFGDDVQMAHLLRAVRDFAGRAGLGVAVKARKWVLLRRSDRLHGLDGYKIVMPVAA